jgi:hypothetical protein
MANSAEARWQIPAPEWRGALAGNRSLTGVAPIGCDRRRAQASGFPAAPDLAAGEPALRT